MKPIGVQHVLAVLCLLSLAFAQSSNQEGHKSRPSSRAYITRYYIEDPSPGSTYETGPLHILFSDETHVIQDLPPKEKSTENNIVFNQEGFSDVQLAEDRKTIGWAETYDNCCTSYAVPLCVVREVNVPLSVFEPPKGFRKIPVYPSRFALTGMNLSRRLKHFFRVSA